MKIGFFWHSISSGNLGVRALSVSNILLVKELACDLGEEVEYVLFGPQQKEDIEVNISNILPKYRYTSITASKLVPHRLVKLFFDINTCDLILDISAGDSFSDVYGSIRFSKMMLSKAMVLKSRSKLILCPQTIGPFNGVMARFFAKFIFNKSRAVYARDKTSYEYGISLCPNAPFYLSTDVAMRLPIKEVALTKELLSNDKINIGINVSGLLLSGGYSKENQFGLSVDYERLIKTLINELAKEGDIEIWLVPHVSSKSINKISTEDDFEASKKLAKELGNVNSCEMFDDPMDAKHFISKLDFFIGSRMHATIAAISSCVPVAALGYSRKFSGLFETLSYPYSYDLTSMGEDEIVENVIHAYHTRYSVQENAIASNKLIEQLLDEYKEGVRRAIIEKRCSN